MNEYFREFDSIFTSFGSQVTAHSNYIVATGFAFAVYLYRLLDRLLSGLAGNPSPLLYDIILLIILISFIILGSFLLGRLFYYVELSGIVQNYMGLSEHSKTYYQSYKQLLEKELERGSGLSDIITESLRFRIEHYLLKRVEEKKEGARRNNFEQLCEICPISERKAFLITIANWLSRARSQIHDVMIDELANMLKNNRCSVVFEYQLNPHSGVDRRTGERIAYGGLIDLMAFRDNQTIAIEFDNGLHLKLKSIEKLLYSGAKTLVGIVKGRQNCPELLDENKLRIVSRMKELYAINKRILLIIMSEKVAVNISL